MMKTKFKFLVITAVLWVFNQASVFAAGGGNAGIQAAATEIKSYMGAVTNIMYAIGMIVGAVGGIRIYIKWTSGDDINKDLLGWGGAFIFLMVVPTVVNGFFG